MAGGQVAGLVLAAGGGSRFSAGPKLLAPVGGRPLLEHALRTLALAGVAPRVVVLGAHAGEVRARVPLHGAEAVLCPRWAEGQAASLRAGLEALEGAAAVLVLLGDQPGIAPEAVQRVLAARAPGVDVARATYAGAPGHPVLLGARALARARRLSGDVGARALLAGLRVTEVPCDGLGDPRDVDTVEDLAATRGAAVGSRPPWTAPSPSPPPSRSAG